MFRLRAGCEREKVAGVLKTILDENPSHWPHGLTPEHFSPSNLWLIEKTSGETVGFVGWQEHYRENEKVGCYSIGVLPDYRCRGIAKQAVAKVVNAKAAGVDRVVAYIAPGNRPSENLAGSLGVKVKRAHAKRVLNWARDLGMGALGGVGIDALNYGDQGVYGALVRKVKGEAPSPYFDDKSLFDLYFNTASAFGGSRVGAHFGAKKDHAGLGSVLGGLTGASVAQGLTASSANARANLMQGMASRTNAEALGEQSQSIRDLAEAIKTKGQQAGFSFPWATLAAATLVYAGLRGLGRSIKDTASRDRGRMRVTLPTKNPQDAETILELPFEEGPPLSNTLQDKLHRDVRRRLYAEVNQRTRRKGQDLPTLTAVR